MFTNDLGLVVITDPQGQLLGFNLVAGGGMGEPGEGGGPAGAHARACVRACVPFGRGEGRAWGQLLGCNRVASGGMGASPAGPAVGGGLGMMVCRIHAMQRQNRGSGAAPRFYEASATLPGAQPSTSTCPRPRPPILICRPLPRQGHHLPPPGRPPGLCARRRRLSRHQGGGGSAARLRPPRRPQAGGWVGGAACPARC